MLSGVLFVGFLCHFTRASPGIVNPSRPQLSSFIAKFSVLLAGSELEVRYYANAETKKQLQVLNLGAQEEDVQAYTWLMVEHNKTVEHDNITPFGFCTGIITPSSPSDENIWFWLKHATYSGKKTFLGSTVNVWIYDDRVNENYYQVGVLSNNTNQPVYYLSTSAIGLIVFDSYENTTPPDSVFNLPSSCGTSDQKSSVEAKHINLLAEHESSMNVFNFKGDTRL